MEKYRIILDGKTYEMQIEKIESTEGKQDYSGNSIAHTSAPYIQVLNSEITQRVQNTEGKVFCPIPGTVVKRYAQNGDTVKAGQIILVLEAMKMENEIAAPRDGIVKQLSIQEGYTARGGELLFEVADD